MPFRPDAIFSSKGYDGFASQLVSRLRIEARVILRAGLRLVEIADHVIDTIDRYSRPPENASEAGGILLGSYRGAHIRIVECSQPLPYDRRTFGLFDRSDHGHQHLAMKHWRESGRTRTFVGEWHTHPESHPSPSFLDRDTWRKVARRNAAGSTVFLIKGYHGWWAELATDKFMTQLVIVPDSD
jgi:integrative and conjugative element protein (TIGR02256 family)